jgi:hypothetical protein
MNKLVICSSKHSMKRFYKPISESEQSSTPNPNPQTLDECESIQLGPPLKKRWLELDLGKLPSDPGLRPRLLDYHPSDREKIRKYYFQKGPCQPREINFPLTKFENLEIPLVSLIWNGIQNMAVGWNIVKRKMQHIAYVVIS